MKERPNLTQFMEQLIRALKEEERFSTAHIYQSTLNALRLFCNCLLYTSPSPRDRQKSRMPSSA